MRRKNKKGQRRSSLWQRVSLKAALVFTTIVCVGMGFLLCSLELAALEHVHFRLYITYIQPYLPEETSGHTLFSSSDGVYIRMEQTVPQAYRDPLTGELYPFETTDSSQFIPQGGLRFFYANSGLFELGVCFLTVGLLFALNAAWFYRWKLKRPLAALSEASRKIARNDLDFHISSPGEDELGKLCGSFEKMRGSLEENNKAMWRAVEERRRLNAAFAHDLRTPLTVLLGYSSCLSEGLSEESISAEKVRQILSSMDRNLKRLQGYVEGMSRVSKLSDLPLQKKSISLSTLSARLEETGKFLLSEGLSFRCRETGKLNLDEDLIVEVFENLISNARRYRRQEVTAEVSQTDGFLLLTVCDDGEGFSKEALKKAAEPYFRGDKATVAKHFGLGLFICRLLCEKHGGFLELSNLPEGGAKLTAGFSGT